MYLGVDYKLLGNEMIKVSDIASIDKAQSNAISFCSSNDKKGLESILNSKSGIILCKSDLLDNLYHKIKSNNSDSKLFVLVDNPRLSFIRIAKIIKEYKVKRKGISKHAIIADSAKIGKDCYIGDFTIIGDGCIVGDNTVIDSRTIIKNAEIGNNCTIQSGTMIGEEGFAFERSSETLELEKFPHYGKVIIKDNVEILANCSVARGSISDTIIKEGAKIDAVCHIAHDVNIGKNTQITAGTVLGESSLIGNNSWLGLNSTIKHMIKVGNNVIVGSGSSIIHDVEDKDIVAGSPAKSIKNKITISHDKIFLMGGLTNTNEHHTNQNRQIMKRDFFAKQLGIAITGLISVAPLLSL
jgi:UDP-3-O-[3-hydroxymyristoyl] glucosamine N-acyltransferase